jgi:trehalose 6-phosphate phosphatase
MGRGVIERPRRFILSQRHLPVLARFAARDVLLAFDYDGTLAPIAPTPDAARMKSTTKRLLTQVARRYPCVVISGRSLDDLVHRVRGVPVRHLAGDHGYEQLGRPRRPTEHVREWLAQLEAALPDGEGLLLEPKRNSLTVHYRKAPDKRRAERTIAAAVKRLRKARAIEGDKAVNLIPSDGPHKGVALRESWRELGCDVAMYVGDDNTDEDAFRVAGPERLLTIRVGTAAPSAAGYRLRRQDEIDALLARLIDLRPR